MLQMLTRRDRDAGNPAFVEMFRARARVFRDRMGWDVKVKHGLEVDRFDDDHDPVYLVTREPEGPLTASLRLLPTTGETMLSSEFRHFFHDDVDVTDPRTWECTRFCVHPLDATGRASSRTAAAELLLGLCDLGVRSGLEHIIGVYDASMIGVYKRLGWSPEPVARSREEVGNLYVGLWRVSEEASDCLSSRLRKMRSDADCHHPPFHPEYPRAITSEISH